MNGESTRIAVAMSGGVDSSVAAAILKDQGYDLVGFSMQLWDQTGQVSSGNERVAGKCCSLDDLYDARAVASHLGFPYYVVNFQKQFARTVVRDFVENYRSGRTPSPCVLCNSHMKFDHLMKIADEVDAQRVATGHYAQVALDRGTGRYLLQKAVFTEKDQSYFLFGLTQQQLSKAVFPLGGMKKQQVRGIARQQGLEVADKPESQEICFVPDGNYADFVERHFREVSKDTKEDPLPPGLIVNRSGRVLGKHQGIHRYTVGQRRGLGIAHSVPLYVVEIQPEANRVVVDERPGVGRSDCRVIDPNWIAISPPQGPFQAHAKIRSRHQESPAVITPCDDGSLEVVFDAPQHGVSPGQAIVFYQEETVVGGGWIARHDL